MELPLNHEINIRVVPWVYPMIYLELEQEQSSFIQEPPVITSANAGHNHKTPHA